MGRDAETGFQVEPRNFSSQATVAVPANAGGATPRATPLPGTRLGRGRQQARGGLFRDGKRAA